MIAWGRAYTDRMSSPRLLAIDTATDQLAVAVLAGDREFCAQEAGGARASQRLLPLVFELLHSAGLQAAQGDPAGAADTLATLVTRVADYRPGRVNLGHVYRRLGARPEAAGVVTTSIFWRATGRNRSPARRCARRW